MSDLYDGMVSVDGLLTVNIGLGESFHCDVKPEYSLKSIKFLIWNNLYVKIIVTSFHSPEARNLRSLLEIVVHFCC